MRTGWVIPLLIGGGIAVACGGSVSIEGGSNSGGSGGSVVVGGAGGTAGFGGTAVGGTGGFDAGQDAKPDAGSGGTGGYVDPGCPDAEPPPPIDDCDPFGPNTCPQGQGCFPFVQYPTHPCDSEVYGAVCAPVGSGTQGEPCGAQNCAAGYVCVITGMGTECVQLCKLNGPNTCPKGLVCVAIDVEGIGGCY